jgi:hypothetical protein
MATTKQQFDDAQALVDQYTSQIADRIQALLAQVAAGGLTDAQETAIFDKIKAQAVTLRPLSQTEYASSANDLASSSLPGMAEGHRGLCGLSPATVDACQAVLA